MISSKRNLTHTSLILLLATVLCAGCVRLGFDHEPQGIDIGSPDLGTSNPSEASIADGPGGGDTTGPDSGPAVTLAVETLAGTGTAGYVDGPAQQAMFKSPHGMVVDSAGKLYVADADNYVIRLVVNGQVSTFAGTGTSGYLDGPAKLARFGWPTSLALDSSGKLYVADPGDHRIRVISNDGQVSTLAGNGDAGFADGPASSASFNHPDGIGVDSKGTVYVAEWKGHRIRKIANGLVSTLAGTGIIGFKDGPASSAMFHGPHGLTLDSAGTVYVAEYSGHRVRAIAGGMVTTLAGTGNGGNTDGPALSAQLNAPAGGAGTGAGTLLVVEAFNHGVRLISNGVVSTVAGTGAPGYKDGLGLQAMFDTPEAITVGPDGAIYVSEWKGHRIRRLLPAN